MVRETIQFEGRVQGVGFRYTAATIAERYKVSGYVQNLRDGRVKLVAEGEADELREFLTALREAMGRKIRSEDVTRAQATGEFGTPGEPHTFTIRYA